MVLPMAEQDSTPQPDTQFVLPDALHNQLWRRVNARLQEGETLITPTQFRQALVEEYQAITGSAPSPELQNMFTQAIAAFNEENPQVYVAQGVQNGVTKAFQAGVEQLEWDPSQIQERGEQAINRFTARDRIQDFLQTVHFSSDQINPKLTVQATTKQCPSAVEPPAPEPAVLAPIITLTEETSMAIREGDIQRSEVDARLAEQEKERAGIERREIQRVPGRVYMFVDQQLLSREEGSQIVQLHKIDQLVARNEIDQKEGSRQRRALMNRETRAALDKKLSDVVDYSVRYLQVFEALQQINPEYDDALRFLIRHKAVVESQDGESTILAAIEELLGDSEILEKTTELMSRQDREIRMIAVSLPPYSHIARQGQERIKNFIITERFVDDLRTLESEKMSERLNSSNREERAEAAASMRCFLELIDHLLKPTAWRKELRLLKIQHVLEEFFRTSDSPEAAQVKAQEFIKRRDGVRKLFGDISQEERATIQQRGMVQAAEEKMATTQPQNQSLLASRPTAPAANPESEDDLTLSSEEIRQGAVIGRVEMRVPNGYRTVRHRIILDPDSPNHFVISQRDNETGELVPLLRNGVKRRVNKEHNGLWRLSS
jgi:hypothetical protein